MQPLGISSPAAHLIEAGYQPLTHDSSLQHLTSSDLLAADMVGFSVPLYDSLAEAAALVSDLRGQGWLGVIIFYGLYSSLNQEALLERGANGIILGDAEDTLVEIVRRVSRKDSLEGLPGLRTRQSACKPLYKRSGRLKPARWLLPHLPNYSYPEANRRLGRQLCVANIEASRGCRFACAYCSVFAAHQQKVIVTPQEAILADVDQVVDSGANHLCFVDAEFLNAPDHAVSLVGRIHARYPSLTFDFTSRADLIAQDPSRIRELVASGAAFVTTAFEFPKQRVLDAINKGFNVQTLRDAVSVCKDAALGLNPTFLYFNPWMEYHDIALFKAFLEECGLAEAIEPIQLQTRLWLYKASPLLNSSEVQAQITEENEFHFEWQHPDPLVELEYWTNRSGDQGTKQRCCLKC
jgi:radical SAM superfamily enzyme YgiQ (UPF0313 family)